MAKWNYVKIGDVRTVERGGSPRPIDKFITDDPNGINWIKIGDTTDSMYITETAQKIIPEGMKKSRYVQPGDFLLSNSMSFGRPYILKIDGCIHDGWLVLRDNGGVFEKRFLYYYLSSPSTYQKFKNMAVGGVVNNLNSDMVRGVTVPVPKMEEQMEIVQTLDNVSNLIFLRKQQLAKLDELVKARFIELFGDYDLTHPQESWVTIKEIGTVVGGATPKTDHDEYWGGSHRWITPAELDADSGYIYDSVRKLTKAGVESCSLQEMPVGTVFLSSRAPIGKVAIAGNTFYCNQGFKNIICKEDITPRYLYTVLLLNVEYLNSLGRGATFKEISKGIVENIRIPVPAMELQKQFAAFVEQTDKSKVAVQKALDEAQLLLDSLMQKYFG